MGIYAIGADRRFKTDDIIKTAIGRPDENGDTFDLITLDWTQNTNHKCARNQKTHGFEDALIIRRGTGLKITYRRPGTAAWKQDALTREFYAQIPDTPYNRSVLTSMYRDRMWKIRETHIDKVIRAQSDLLWQNMSSDSKAYETARISSMWRNRYDPDDLNSPPQPSAKSEEKGLNNDRAKIYQERKELEELKEKIKRDQEKLEHMLEQAEKCGVRTRQYDENWLSDQRMPKLRQICSDIGLKMDLHDKKDDLVTKIMAYQHGQSLESGIDKSKELADGPSEGHNDDDSDGDITE